jgi:hypothetical protein
MSEFNSKWYILGTIVGIFAGIGLSYLMFG